MGGLIPPPFDSERKGGVNMGEVRVGFTKPLGKEEALDIIDFIDDKVLPHYYLREFPANFLRAIEDFLVKVEGYTMGLRCAIEDEDANEINLLAGLLKVMTEHQVHFHENGEWLICDGECDECKGV